MHLYNLACTRELLHIVFVYCKIQVQLDYSSGYLIYRCRDSITGDKNILRFERYIANH